MKKKMIFAGLGFLLLCILTYAGIYAGLSRTSRQVLNRETAAFVQKVHEIYPDIPEEELVRILQEETELPPDDIFLEKYGYQDGIYYSAAVRKQIGRFVLWSGIAAVFLIGTGVFAVYLYMRRRRRQTEELIRYTQNIARGIYDLRIDSNSEDEFSRLSNALYKITVLLKESAENSRKESEGLSRSLADISHQIKTPLTSIQIMLDNIAENPEMDTGTRQDFLQMISVQIDRISSLVVTLLQLARFDSGSVEMKPQETDIGQMVTDIFRDLSVLAEIRNVELVQNIEAGTSWMIDRKWQQQAIANIVKNAIEHSPFPAGTAGDSEEEPDGSVRPRVTVSAEQNSLFLRIRISDEGEGISREDQRHIFDRFYKAENRSADSIGIGLNFAKTVIEKEGGTISVDSAVGEGTVFTIRYFR